MAQKGRFSEIFPVDSSSFFLVSMEKRYRFAEKTQGEAEKFVLPRSAVCKAMPQL